MNKLLLNLDKVHTTKLGEERIRKNLNLSADDVVLEIKNIISSKSCNIYERGKNCYCQTNNIKITINKSSYTIITAHTVK